MTYVKDISTTDFANQVIERSRQIPVVVDFWAEWCGPCKVLGPTLERLAAEGGGSWELAKVDVDQNQQLAMQFGVQGIPTVVAFKDGQPVSRFTGALPEAQVREFLGQLVPSELDLLAASGEQALEAGDDTRAEQAFRAVLDSDPTHEVAGLGMAGLLLEQGDAEGALEVLSRLAKTEDVRRLEAYARLSGTEGADLEALATAAEGGDSADLLAYGKSLAAAGRHAEALDILIDVVGRREENAEDARQLAVDLFDLLGSDNPTTIEYRRRLASALF